MSAHQEQRVYLKGVSRARSSVLFSYVLFSSEWTDEALPVTSHTTVDGSFLPEVSGGACSYESTNHNAEEV